MPSSETRPGVADRLAPSKRFTNFFLFRQVRGAGSGTESQLRVSWDGVLNAEQTGRWWIVGSAWSGTPMIDNSQQKAPQKPPAGTVRDPCSPLPVGLTVALPGAVSLLSAGCYKMGRCGLTEHLVELATDLRYNLIPFLLLLFKGFVSSPKTRYMKELQVDWERVQDIRTRRPALRPRHAASRRCGRWAATWISDWQGAVHRFAFRC